MQGVVKSLLEKPSIRSRGLLSFLWWIERARWACSLARTKSRSEQVFNKDVGLVMENTLRTAFEGLRRRMEYNVTLASSRDHLAIKHWLVGCSSRLIAVVLVPSVRLNVMGF